VTRHITSVLLAVSALLALALAALWFSPATRWRTWSPPSPQAPNLGDAQTALLNANPAAAAAYPAVLARPLFQPSRRPPAPAASTAAQQQPAPIEQVKLLGLVNGPALTGVLLEDQGAQRFVRRDEQVGDWTLKAIDGRNAVFMRGGERKQIELPFTYLTPASAAPPAGQPPAAAPPPKLPLRKEGSAR
jgi:hypothetical protein